MQKDLQKVQKCKDCTVGVGCYFNLYHHRALCEMGAQGNEGLLRGSERGFCRGRQIHRRQSGDKGTPGGENNRSIVIEV